MTFSLADLPPTCPPAPLRSAARRLHRPPVPRAQRGRGRGAVDGGFGTGRLLGAPQGCWALPAGARSPLLDVRDVVDPHDCPARRRRPGAHHPLAFWQEPDALQSEAHLRRAPAAARAQAYRGRARGRAGHTEAAAACAHAALARGGLARGANCLAGAVDWPGGQAEHVARCLSLPPAAAAHPRGLGRGAQRARTPPPPTRKPPPIPRHWPSTHRPPHLICHLRVPFCFR